MSTANHLVEAERILQRMIEKNPVLQKLIDDLDLVHIRLYTRPHVFSSPGFRYMHLYIPPNPVHKRMAPRAAMMRVFLRLPVC